MFPVTPSTAEELGQKLLAAAKAKRSIAISGAGTKRLMGGPIAPADVTISTRALNRILEYEPNDLTISVEAGHNFGKLQEVLAQRGQMIALDPPFFANATVGGVVAANSSGPMRKLFGTARDLVIGMKFALLNGKIANAGGMVVKNVAGLDIGKLMVGSFGTLGVITSVNLRLHARFEATNTYLFSYADLKSAIEQRDLLLRGFLKPFAMDLLSPPASARLGLDGYVLALRAGGSKVVLRRYERELSRGEILTGEQDEAFWSQVREFPAQFVNRQPNGVILRLGAALSEMFPLLNQISGPFIARAATGVTYVYLSSFQLVPALWEMAKTKRWTAAIEFANDADRAIRDLWLMRAPEKRDHSFAMMKKMKQMFDPNNLLNRSRLYGRL